MQPTNALPFDMGSLSTPFTSVTAEAAAEVARDLYGIGGSFRRFASEQDDTFRIVTPEGAAYVMKIANPGEALAELDIQMQALRRIALRDPGLPVPRVFDALTGETLPVVATGPAAGRRVRLLSFLDGDVVDTLPLAPDLLPEIGGLLARLRLALEGFDHPAAGRQVAWDVRRLPSLAPLVADVEDPEHRRRLEPALARMLELVPRIEALRRQVLHNDVNRSNLVAVSGRIAGVIDFGDVVETAVAIDVSTTMLAWLPRSVDPDADLLALPKLALPGYLARADLTEEEVALLPHLVMGRAVSRALITLWRARQFPENRAYILRNTDQGWAQLDWFLARSVDGLSDDMLTYQETIR